MNNRVKRQTCSNKNIFYETLKQFFSRVGAAVIQLKNYEKNGNQEQRGRLKHLNISFFSKTVADLVYLPASISFQL